MHRPRVGIRLPMVGYAVGAIMFVLKGILRAESQEKILI
jgi:hypothetical protein